jgi:FAD:protein FMN transferase
MKMTRRHAVFGFAALGGGLALASGRAVTATRPGTAFGTTVRLTVSARSSADGELALERGFAEIRAVEKTFNLFDAESELSHLNATGELDRPSSMMLDLVQRVTGIHHLTQGAFDPSVQPLWTVWQNALRKGAQPDGELITQATAKVGWAGLDVSIDKIWLKQKEAALTFNGIAQGYAADRVMAAIRPFALSAIIDTGEFGISSLDETPRLAIRHPRNADAVAGHITAASGYVATSGDYATTFTPDFLHHHIFDPANGVSPRELSAVTVLAPTGAMADGLATAFMVMGRNRTLALAEAIGGVDVLLITKQGEFVQSSGMAKHFTAA